MPNHQENGIGKEYLLLFGTIVQKFAAHELLMMHVMARVLGTQTGSVVLLTRSLSFEEKCKLLLDLMRLHRIPLDQYDRINAYLDIPRAHIQLCHDIVHAEWVPAKPPAALQPDWILKPPAQIQALYGAASQTPRSLADDEETSYSREDLTEISAALENNLADLRRYLHEVDLIDKS